MKKTTMNQKNNLIPEFFSRLIEEGLIGENNIEKTDDGFFCLNKCISAILADRDIYTFLTKSGDALRCDKYFDDWYFYALKHDDDFVYSLFKLREQEYDMYAGEKADYDSPGATVSFISFSTDLFLKCLEDSVAANVSAVSDEINRVVAWSGQSHHPVMKAYFRKTKSKAPYLIAELYIKHILSFTHKGFVIVPQRYEEIYSASITMPKKHKTKRIPDFIDKNNEAAGYTVCDHDKIYIKDPDNPNEYEKLAILATHTADTSYNCFAAEVQYHAFFLFGLAKIRIPFIGSIYESAIRADLSIDDRETEGNAPYHKPDSKLVRKQMKHHGVR